MDSLPNSHLAMVDERKIKAYLLSTSYPAGRAKAAFFQNFGFQPSSWVAFREALLAHGRTAAIIAVTETEFGKKYILEGKLAAPDGRTPRVRAVWFIATGDIAPQLVTAYPAQGAEE